jgi:hypothetical protein
MQKVFGILLIVGLVWAGIEFMTKGDAAFGGLLASGSATAADTAVPGQRAGERLRREADARFDRMERTISD